MPNSAKARSAIQQIRDDDFISEDRMVRVMAEIESFLRDVEPRAMSLEMELRGVRDPQDRAHVTERARNIIGGLREKLRRLYDEAESVLRTIREANEVAPQMLDRLTELEKGG